VANEGSAVGGGLKIELELGCGSLIRLFRQILENLLGEDLVDFPVAGNRLRSTGSRVVINVVAGTVPQQLAASFF
jgi:hypothetical protein